MLKKKNSSVCKYVTCLSIVAVVLSVSALANIPIENYSDFKLIPWTKTQGQETAYEAEIIRLAQTDHIALLTKARDNYNKTVRDYTGIFGKQEQIRGKLGPSQQISFMFKEKPFSLLMEWEQNAGKIDKLLYVEGQNDNKMVVHPTGMLAWIKSVKKDPNCKEVKAATLNPCTRFGFNRTIKSVLDVYNLAAKKGDLKINYLGETSFNGRHCVAMERILPRGRGYEVARLIIELDIESMVPVSLTSFDWNNKLYSRYTFENMRFNTGMADETFTAKANQM